MIAVAIIQRAEQLFQIGNIADGFFDFRLAEGLRDDHLRRAVINRRAEIEEAVVSSLYDVFYLEKELETADVLRSVVQTVPLSRTMAEGISSLRGWADGRARQASPREKDAMPALRRKLEI